MKFLSISIILYFILILNFSNAQNRFDDVHSSEKVQIIYNGISKLIDDFKNGIVKVPKINDKNIEPMAEGDGYNNELCDIQLNWFQDSLNLGDFNALYRKYIYSYKTVLK